jgi:hypothetical protein
VIVSSCAPWVRELSRKQPLRKGAIHIATQTETQRRAAAQKAAATRRQNAAKRSRSAQKAAETRARAQASRLKALGWQAQRVADTAVGAAVSGGEKVVDTVKPLRSSADLRREVSRLRRRGTVNLRKVERRGATARKRAQRTVASQRGQVTRAVRRNRREAEQQVKSARDEVGRRIDEAQTTAEEAFGRLGSDARGLA